jgi:hypothetical protein
MKTELPENDEQPCSSSQPTSTSAQQDESIDGSLSENMAARNNEEVVRPGVKESVSTESHPSAPPVTPTPAQDRINKDIVAVQSEITALVCRRNINALTPEDMKRKQMLENDLKKKISNLKSK